LTRSGNSYACPVQKTRAPAHMSWELECPFCHTVFRTPDDELAPREVSADWIKRAMQTRDARVRKSRLVQKALGGDLSFRLN
jgi:hypothetical protein